MISKILGERLVPRHRRPNTLSTTYWLEGKLWFAYCSFWYDSCFNLALQARCSWTRHASSLQPGTKHNFRFLNVLKMATLKSSYDICFLKFLLHDFFPFVLVACSYFLVSLHYFCLNWKLDVICYSNSGYNSPPLFSGICFCFCLFAYLFCDFPVF